MSVLTPCPPYSTAQVEVLSAALRASSLDAHEETVSIEKRGDLEDDLGINELPNCKISHDDTVPLISDAIEVRSPVQCYPRVGTAAVRSLWAWSSCSSLPCPSHLLFVARSSALPFAQKKLILGHQGQSF